MYVNPKDTTSHRLSPVAVQLIKYGQSTKLETHLNHNLNKVECHSADDDNDSLQVMWTTK
jgi:hypothetical protein